MTLENLHNDEKRPKLTLIRTLYYLELICLIYGRVTQI